jgi:hypothetical protein
MCARAAFAGGVRSANRSVGTGPRGVCESRFDLDSTRPALPRWPRCRRRVGVRVDGSQRADLETLPQTRS